MEKSQFLFLGYRISRIDFNLTDDFNPNQFEIKFDVNHKQNFFTDKPGLVEVVLDITVKSTDGRLSFFLTIKGGFQAESSISKELLSSLAKINAPAILFPFARAIITSYTAQANIPAIILPAINFAAPPEASDLLD
ncbi:MAG: protein-export chaperone SecB [Ignavibacteria bacterium]